MASFSAEGGGYQEAVALNRSLNSAGIEANISAQCVAIYPEPAQVKLMLGICKEHKFLCQDGLGSAVESVLMQSRNSSEWAKNAQLNARAVRQEMIVD